MACLTDSLDSLNLQNCEKLRMDFIKPLLVRLWLKEFQLELFTSKNLEQINLKHGKSITDNGVIRLILILSFLMTLFGIYKIIDTIARFQLN